MALSTTAWKPAEARHVLPALDAIDHLRSLLIQIVLGDVTVEAVGASWDEQANRLVTVACSTGDRLLVFNDRGNYDYVETWTHRGRTFGFKDLYRPPGGDGACPDANLDLVRLTARLQQAPVRGRDKSKRRTHA